jgi:hypothetical protein
VERAAIALIFWSSSAATRTAATSIASATGGKIKRARTGA